MQNIVDLSAGRARSRGTSEIPQEGAQILLFTGVRYVREPEPQAPAFVPEMSSFHRADINHRPEGLVELPAVSEACLDLTAH